MAASLEADQRNEGHHDLRELVERFDEMGELARVVDPAGPDAGCAAAAEQSRSVGQYSERHRRRIFIANVEN